MLVYACEAEVASQHWLHTSHSVALILLCHVVYESLCLVSAYFAYYSAEKHFVPAGDTFDCKHHDNLHSCCVVKMTASKFLAGRRGGYR